MVAEVHRIDGASIEQRGEQGDADVIAQLEWMLDRTRKGHITAFAVVMRDQDIIGTATRGTWRGGFFEAIGALAVLQIDMSNGSCAGPSED